MKRRIKIEEQITEGLNKCYLSKQTRVPKVRLAGKWLQAAGFNPGTHLELTVISPGVIELRVCGVPRVDHEFQIAAMRLDHAIAADEARRAREGK
jgi:hypothetical protein